MTLVSYALISRRKAIPAEDCTETLQARRAPRKPLSRWGLRIYPYPRVGLSQIYLTAPRAPHTSLQGLPFTSQTSPVGNPHHEGTPPWECTLSRRSCSIDCKAPSSSCALYLNLTKTPPSLPWGSKETTWKSWALTLESSDRSRSSRVSSRA